MLNLNSLNFRSSAWQLAWVPFSFFLLHFVLIFFRFIFVRLLALLVARQIAKSGRNPFYHFAHIIFNFWLLHCERCTFFSTIRASHIHWMDDIDLGPSTRASMCIALHTQRHLPTIIMKTTTDERSRASCATNGSNSSKNFRISFISVRQMRVFSGMLIFGLHKAREAWEQRQLERGDWGRN